MKQIFEIQADQMLGNTITLAAGEAAPPNYTFMIPPAHPSGERVLWTGNGWQVLNSTSTIETLVAQSEHEASALQARVLIHAVDAERDTRIAQGKPHSFPDGNIGTVQLRNERDTVNVNAVATSGTALVIAGNELASVAFRDAEDVTHALKGSEAVAFGQSVMAWVSAHYTSAWAHKDAIRALAEQADGQALTKYNIRAGWPVAAEGEEAEIENAAGDAADDGAGA